MVKRRKRRRKALRVPKGVTVDGRSIGGRFISHKGLADLVPRTDDRGRKRLATLVGREVKRQQRAYDRVSRRFDDDPKRYALPLAKSEADFRFWQHADDDIAELTDDLMADEWEIGVDYHPVGGPPSSHVDINIRIRRTDGAAMGFKQAQRTMEELRENIRLGRDQPVPRGYMVAGVDWKRPYHAFDFTEGSPLEFEVFRDVLYIAADTSPWRLGGVDT